MKSKRSTFPVIAPSGGNSRRRSRALLFVIAGPGQGAVFPLRTASSVLGRGQEAAVHLPDDAVSNRHAQVIQRDGGYYLVDDGSRNGSFVNDEQLLAPRRLNDGDHIRIGNSLLLFSMVDELEERALTRLFELATRDALTRTFNRRYLMDHLRSELAFAARQHIPLALLLIDIDHFKSVNDRYGHRTGDVVLQLVASSIQRMLRPYDVLCRYGGEEFVVVARDTNLRNAQILAERIRQHIERLRFEVSGASDSVTVSIGVSSLRPGHAPDEVENMLERVDEALYAAKAAGRNRVHITRAGREDPPSSHSPPHTLPPRASSSGADREPRSDEFPPRPRLH